jgi:hypothetical protein
MICSITLQNIEKDLQHLHVETLHPYHVVPELEQDCDTGSRNWILNPDRQYRDTSQSFAPLDAGLIVEPASTSIQLSHLVY